MRCALKFGYDGTRFRGFARQPGKATVEGALIDALVHIGAITDTRSAHFQKASRTDAGVSAAGNVIAFNTTFPLDHIVAAVNGRLENIWIYAAAEVPATFSPRRAHRRQYRYFLFVDGASDDDLATLRKGAALFVGEHDFRFFARAREKNPVRRIHAIDVQRDGDLITIDITAQTFLWNMVRRMISVLERYRQGSVTHQELEDALRGTKRVHTGLAPAENLMLLDVRYPFAFEQDARSACVMIAKKRQENQRELLMLDAVSDRINKK